METDAYNGTPGHKLQPNIADENFFYRNIIRTFRSRQMMSAKNFFKMFSSAATRFCSLVCVAALVLFVLHAYAENPDCKKFRDGKFKMVDSKAGVTFFLTREGTRQTELMEGSKDTSVFVVTWTDDCTYTLTPTKETFKKYPDLPANAVLTIRITETTDSSYFQTSMASFSEMVQYSEVIKLH
jgi:hypothetical protein